MQMPSKDKSTIYLRVMLAVLTGSNSLFPSLSVSSPRASHLLPAACIPPFLHRAGWILPVLLGLASKAGRPAWPGQQSCVPDLLSCFLAPSCGYVCPRCIVFV